MKKITTLLSIGIIALSSCKRNDSTSHVKLTSDTTILLDTTYVVSPVPAPEPHNVLIEAFCGPSCSNWPAGDSLISWMDSMHIHRINTIGLMPDDFSISNPIDSSNYDFRSPLATQIEQQIFGALYAMPEVGIDRMPLGESTLGSVYQVVLRSLWPGDVNSQLVVPDSINLSVSSTYDPATHNATITTTVTYLQPSAALQSLSIAVVEDSLIDWQEDGMTINSHYHFNNVLRGLVTVLPHGSPILPAIPTKEAGRVATRTYLYPINTTLWNPAHMRVIAFVTNASDGRHVYQSKQVQLTP